MVNESKVKSSFIEADIHTDIPQEEIRWSTVKLSEVLRKDYRLEASVFDIEGKHAREILDKCKWEIVSLTGLNGLADAYHRPRFKRIRVEHSKFPIYQPGQVTEINPKPSGYLSELTDTDINLLRVKKGQILLTCSGTIGNCTLVSDTLNDKIFSHDLIRINPKNDIDKGYIYAFLKTKIGRVLINTNNYGAVISHIEPVHLNEVFIPNPPPIIKTRINDLIMLSFKLRDQSNDMLEQAEKLMYDELQLPPIDKLNLTNFDEEYGMRNTSVKLSELKNRFEGSYHLPIVKSILELYRNNADEVTVVGDKRVSDEVFLPGRFTRVYVEEGQGTVFFGGKQLLNLDPSISEKYLSTKMHSDRLNQQLKLQENSILISRSGTIGKISLVPKHWVGWAASEDLIRIFPAKDMAGYLFVYLNSDYGQVLTKRFVYGSVQDHIEDIHTIQIEVPLLKEKAVQDKINSLALQANELRYKAYKLEQEAISIMNKDVIHAVN